MKSIYPEGKNPFARKKIVNFKQTLTYPNQGDIRFRVQTDKNGQVYEIRQTTAQVIKDPESKKRFVKVLVGPRPQRLFERIKGRPLTLALPWIDEYVSALSLEETQE